MMEEDLAALKRTLISLVVSSPTIMTVDNLIKDYRNLVGGKIPVYKFGYRDVITFIRERCLDIFVVEGPSRDPILTPIVTENLKHIDQMVQKQKVHKGKRRCVSGAVNRSHTPNTPLKQNLVCETFKSNNVCHPPNNHVDGSSKDSNVSGAHSSGSSLSKLEEMKNEIVELIRASAEGVWFTDLMRLYKEVYGRELNIHRFGRSSLGNLVSTLRDRIAVTRPDPLGDYLLQNPASVVAEGRERAVTQPLQRSAPNHSRRDPATNPDDALPGVESDADVYPEDCMHHLDTIPSADISALAAGSQLEVVIGEVYSPSHFWLQQVGPEHNLAMESMMDRMNEHYMTDARQLAPGALRVGQYCAALYDKDWHRSIIVEIIDSDTVKVRHVDYGTVETVTTSDLRYLPRKFGQLRAQAVRALLAACRPSARGQRWPHAAATDFLRAVRDKRLYANIVAVDREEVILETFLTDTSGESDVCMTRKLVRLGHADPRYDSALARDESYLYPRFDALETASTPNYAEICRLLVDGIELDFVDAYRRHVPGPSTTPLPPPASLSPPVRLSPPAPPPPPVDLDNRVPLLRLEFSEEPSAIQPSLSQHQPTQPPLLQYQITQPQYQPGHDFLSQFQNLQVREASQYQISQPPISQYQTVQSQYRTTQSQYRTTYSQYQTAQSRLLQLRKPQLPYSQYPTSRPPPSQVQTPQAAFQLLSLTLPKPPTHWPAHAPLVPSQAVRSSVQRKTRSSQPFILPTLPVGNRQLPPDRRVRLPTPPLPTFMPTIRPTPSSTQPLAQPYFQPTAPGVPPLFRSTQAAHSSVPFQPSRSSPPAHPAPSAPIQPALSAPIQPASTALSQPASTALSQPASTALSQPASTALSQPSQSPIIPPGFKSPGAVPPMPNEVRLTEEEWTVLGHLRATDPTAAEYFLTLTARRADIVHRHGLPQSMRSFESTPVGDSGGRPTAAAADSDK